MSPALKIHPASDPGCILPYWPGSRRRPFSSATWSNAVLATRASSSMLNGLRLTWATPAAAVSPSDTVLLLPRYGEIYLSGEAVDLIRGYQIRQQATA